MQRLLLGDVGAGKTVVAVHAMLRAAEHGRQAALMAPTETLARQHFRTLQQLVPGELLPMALLTGSTKAADRKRILYALRGGQLGLVDRHARADRGARGQFHALSVVVIDEQHRFGVRQRARSKRKRQPVVRRMCSISRRRRSRARSACSNSAPLDVTERAPCRAGGARSRRHIAETAEERERGLHAAARAGRRPAGRRSSCVRSSRTPRSSRPGPRPPSSCACRTGRCVACGWSCMHGQMPPADKEAAMARFVAGEARCWSRRR